MSLEITTKEHGALLDIVKLKYLGVDFVVRNDKVYCIGRYDSDLLHELIRRCGYEMDCISEREPQGLVRLRLSKYMKDSERESGGNPIVDMQEANGWTLREALVVGLLKIIKEGV